MAVVAYRSATTPATKWILVAGCFLLATALGMARTDWHSQQFTTSQFDSVEGQEVVFSGTVVREPDRRETTTHLYIEHGEELILVTIDRYSDVSYGDELLVSGVIERPEEFATEFGRTFDYPGYLLARGVTHRVSFADIAVLSGDNGNPVLATLFTIKQSLVTGIDNSLQEPSGGLAKGLLLGMKQSLGEQLETAFQASGLTHIVVLSGYNVMLVVAFIMTILSLFLGLRSRIIFGLVAIVGFALLVGLSATVVRASIMASLVLLSQLFSRSYHVVRALFLAGLLMVVVNPYVLIYDIGFQLSFMATLGLVLIVPRFEMVLSQTSQGTIYFREFFFATLATQIAVLPLLLYHIGQVSVVAVLVNVLVLPMVPVAMFLAFVSAIVFMTIPWLVATFGAIAQLSLLYIIAIATWFAALPFATLTLPAFSVWWVVASYILVPLCWYAHQRYLANRTTDTMSDWEIVEEDNVKAGSWWLPAVNLQVV